MPFAVAWRAASGFGGAGDEAGAGADGGCCCTAKEIHFAALDMAIVGRGRSDAAACGSGGGEEEEEEEEARGCRADVEAVQKPRARVA